MRAAAYAYVLTVLKMWSWQLHESSEKQQYGENREERREKQTDGKCSLEGKHYMDVNR